MGVDFLVKDEHGRTALHHAAARVAAGNVVPLLLQYAQLSAEVAQGNGKTNRYMKDFLEAKSIFGRTALHEAAAFTSRSQDIQALLQSGARAIALDREKGWTSLYYACFFGHEESVNLLLALGANIHARDKLGRTPLAVSVKRRRSLGLGMVSDAELGAENG